MKPKTDRSPGSVVREIKRKTRRKFNPEEKNQDHLRRSEGRIQHLRYLSSRGHLSEFVLQMEQGFFTSWQTRAQRGYAS